MERIFPIFIISFIALCFCSISFAGQAAPDSGLEGEGKDQELIQAGPDLPWEKLTINLGGFISTIDSSMGVGLNNIGINLDLEDVLDLDSTTYAFRLDTLWRFTDNLRHRFDFTWFDLKRNSVKTLEQEVEIGGETFPIGTTLESKLDIKIFKGVYSYSFFQDDRFDLAASIGLFIVPIDYSLRSLDGQYKEEADTLTAPLPVIGIRGDFAITPKVFLKTNLDFFYLEFDNYTGSIINSQIALEYNMFKHVGIGLGYEHLEVDASAKKESDVPLVDFNGNIVFSYTGVKLYAKIYF